MFANLRKNPKAENFHSVEANAVKNVKNFPHYTNFYDKLTKQCTWNASNVNTIFNLRFFSVFLMSLNAMNKLHIFYYFIFATVHVFFAVYVPTNDKIPFYCVNLKNLFCSFFSFFAFAGHRSV